MKTDFVPAIIMLLAGLVDSVISIYYKQDLYSFSKRLLLVLVIFYILGYIVKIILDINFPDEKKKKEASNEESEESVDSEEGEESDIENIETNEETEEDNTEE